MRTRHLDENGLPKYSNRLKDEDSPYLRQHAHNPVDWFPWGAEAFSLARELQRPVFLSIGYSTCHWCHVMEHESFENEEIAALLNAHFVSIKLDREQRPDIDEIYMTGVQVMSGHGGWPMSSFLTPEGAPFFAGTYYPPPQFADLLQRVTQAWQHKRKELEAQAAQVRTVIAQLMDQHGDGKTQTDTASAAARAEQSTLQNYDAKAGGYGQAPKFPHEPLLLFLLTRAAREPVPALMQSLQHTLRRMAQGGIYDHVGGGFHRYAVDAEWLVPHFEKMLYNQAALLRVYVQAYRLSGESYFRLVAEEIIAYVLRDMCSAQGLFYSGTDADSEGEEGLFFVWSEREIDEMLPRSLAQRVKTVYGVTPRGNFEGRNILNLTQTPAEFAAAHALEERDLLRELAEAKEQLYLQREKRIHPLRDEKIITAWNGMMLTALAEASLGLGRQDCLEVALRGAQALWQLHGGDTPGALWRISLGGQVSIPAMQEDYACLAESMLALYDASGERLWLERAQSLVRAMDSLFLDQDGLYFQSRADQEVALISRVKTLHDGATACGNAVALTVLEALHRRTGERDYLQRLRRMVAMLGNELERHPQACAYSLRACEIHAHGEHGPLQWAGGGKIRVHAMLRSAEARALQLELQIQLPPGLYLYGSDQPEQLAAATVIELSPEQVLFQRLYQASEHGEATDKQQRLGGEIVVQAGLKADVLQGGCLRFALRLQACGEGFCLPPERLSFVLPLPRV